VAAAGTEQLGPARAVQTGGDHHEGADSAPPAVFGDSRYSGDWSDDDRQVHMVRQGGHRRQARHAM